MKILKKIGIFVFLIVSISTPFFSYAETNTKSKSIIFIQNGGIVEDSSWNNGTPFYVSLYGDQEKLDQAINIAKNHFKMFDVTVTDDSTLYESKEFDHRIKIIVGSTNILGKDTGYSHENSYYWGRDSIGFVLVNNCNPNTMATDIGHLVAHESGHILGLEHKLNSDGTFDTGFGTGQRSVGFVMGNFTGKNYVIWDEAETSTLNLILGSKYSSI
jgi:hypothetical protein